MNLYIEKWTVIKDNKMVFKGTNNKCFEHVLNDQGNSVDYACKYGGYKILKSVPASPTTPTKLNIKHKTKGD
jgi:hypothetical protein